MSVIGNDEHVFVGGLTGWGKSYWLANYLATRFKVLKLDTKGEALVKIRDKQNPWEQVSTNDLVVITDFEALKQHDFKRKSKVIYVPTFEELDDPQFFEDFFKWAFFKFNNPRDPFVLWVDELKDVCPNPTTIPKYMKAFYTKGRFFNSTIWGASQEPRHLPSVCMSQATHLIAFDLPRIEDRKRLADNTGTGDFLKPLQKYHFWYFMRGWGSASKGMIDG